MRHGRALGQAVQDGVRRVGHLILVAGQLRRHVMMRHQGVIVVIDVDALHVVDVLADDIAVRAPDVAAAVRGDEHRGLRGGHRAVRIVQGDGVVRVHAGLVRGHRGHDAIDRTRAQHHVNEVQRVYADVEQRAAGQHRIGHTRLAGHRVAQVRVHHLHLADHARGHDVVDHAARRHVARPDGLGAQQPRRLGHGQQFARLRRVGGERLLHQDVLAGLQTHDALLGMQAVRGGDVHQIHLRVGQQLLIRAVGDRETVLCSEGGGALAVACGHRVRGHQVGVARVGRHLDQRGRHRMRDASGAEDRHIHLEMFGLRLRAVAVESAHRSSLKSDGVGYAVILMQRYPL